MVGSTTKKNMALHLRMTGWKQVTTINSIIRGGRFHWKKNNAFVLTTEGREEISERKKWGKGLKAKKTAHAKVLRWNKPEVLKKGKNASVSEVP